MSDVTPLEDFLAKQKEETATPLQKAEKLIADSKAVIIEGGQEANYDKIRDAIFVPEKNHFENDTKYVQAVIHQLAHWAGHESRLNRPMEGKFGSMDYAKEEMRAAIAGIIIGGELKIGHNFGHQAAYMNHFAKILKDEPFEIAKAARDAQKIVNLLLGTDLKREQKQQAEVTFKQGDQIAYMDTTYKVLETYKNKSIRVEDADGARKTLKPDYGLYKSLLEAKRDPQGVGQAIEETKSQSKTSEQEYQIER
ncbi:zincin-like metallopeptidase domain-containing protein [Mucilaginibacter sp. UC70_90]